MPAWLGIYDAGIYENGIHGIPYNARNGERAWVDLVGTPITFGCIMLEDAVARYADGCPKCSRAGGAKAPVRPLSPAAAAACRRTPARRPV